MENSFIPFTQTESLLLTAIGLQGHSIKHIAAVTGINPSTLYKWKTTSVHLSPQKADALMLYFLKNEPLRLERAKLLQAANL